MSLTEMESYRDLILENIEYDYLCREVDPYQENLDEIVELMVETVCAKRQTTSVYAHILDEDRKINAQKFESAFYANPNLREVHPPEEPREQAPATLDLEALVEQLRQSPELANTLAALLSAAPGGR